MPARKIASTPVAPPALDRNLLEAAHIIESQLQQPSFNSESCLDYLKALEGAVENANPRAVQDEVAQIGMPLVNELWKVRVALHSRLSELNPKCVNETRNTMRLFRFVEDYLAERMLGIRPLDPANIKFDQSPIPLMQQVPEYLVEGLDDSRKLEFKPGDLMVTRGVSFMSATISRIGDIQSQFSHVVFVHIDEATGKPSTIESYVGKGVTHFTMEDALKNENARILLLRPKDSLVGKRADQYLYRVSKAALDAGRPIPYDYALDFKDHHALSCAEVAQVAYEQASEGQVNLPYFPSTISSDPEFLRRIGMAPGQTFTPGDLEVDPRFDMVLEFRNLSLTRDSRFKDAILTSMLSWMDQYGYELRETPRSWVAGHVVWNSRSTFLWPMVQRTLKLQDFSKEIPQTTFQTVALLNELGGILLKYLHERDDEFEKATGWPMTYQDLYRTMDELRQKDLETYKNRKTRKHSLFHFAFRPKQL